jgi:uncharacterized membrane protein YdcZ (DUF606 family)
MRLRPRRESIVIWSSSGILASTHWDRRPARLRRIRWWLRTGAFLVVIGLRCVARGARARWEPVSLAAGAALMIIGFELPSAFVAYLVGMLVLVVTLLKGIRSKGRSVGQAADCWQWHG